MFTRILSVLLLVSCLMLLPGGPAFAQPPARASRPLDRTENILLLGSDTEPGRVAWRTDTIIILAIDRGANRVGLISVPRDLFVNIPGAGRDRVNTIDYIGEHRDGPGGGPALLSAVLSQTLGIRTQHYVRIDMAEVTHLIDELGGITVVLDQTFREDVPDPSLLAQGRRVPLSAGPHHLDGATALAYLRARYVTGDLDRTRRQQQIIWAVAQRIKELGWLSQLWQLWPEFSGKMQSDLSLGDALSLGWLASQLKPENIHNLTFTYNLARPWTTPQGAQVLLLADRRRVDAWIDGLFDAPCSICSGAVPAAPAPFTVTLPPPAAPSWAAFGQSVATPPR